MYTFDDILNLYEDINFKIDRMYPKDTCIKQNAAAKAINMHWFHLLKIELDYIPPYFDAALDEKYNDNGIYPTYLVDYRDNEIPVYVDDAGQQFYAIIDGLEICGGAYMPLESFLQMLSDEYDAIVENKKI